MVDLPDAERPVSQMVRPLCLSSPARMAGVSGLAWKWMFLQFQDEVSNEEVVLCNHEKQSRVERSSDCWCQPLSRFGNVCKKQNPSSMQIGMSLDTARSSE
jgi:hypothetical protein